MESDNTPDVLRAAASAPMLQRRAGLREADHNRKITDYGFEIGGPIVRDKAWFYASFALQTSSWFAALEPWSIARS